ncbi:MAG: MASE3 domain-containing protein [Pseudomonadota bacterium]
MEDMKERPVTLRISATIITAILVLFGLYLTNLYNYLLFHSLAEIFSIVVASGIFIVAWNSRRFLDNNYLLFIGIAYICSSEVWIWSTRWLTKA